MKILLTILLFSMGILAQNGLEKVSWLTGCWGGVMKDGSKYEECWTSPSKVFMQGAGSMTNKDKVLMREAMTIELEGKDIVMYIALYGAKMKLEQDPIAFKLVKSSSTELVFENPAHDYPQRIVYTKDKKGDITARIEQMDKSKPMTFPMNNLMKK